jgi:hypothetical protein
MRGKQSNKITVLYSVAGDKETYSLDLGMKGNVIPLYHIEPEEIKFSRKKADVKIIKLISHDEQKPVKINFVTCYFQGFDVKKVNDQEISGSFTPQNWKDETGVVPFFGIETDCVSEKHMKVPISLFD